MKMKCSFTLIVMKEILLGSLSYRVRPLQLFVVLYAIRK